MGADLIQQKLAAANADGDFGLSEDEVAEFVAAGGTQMLDLVERFDANRDGQLDAKEMDALNRFLLEEAAALPPKVNKLAEDGIGGHMLMTMFGKGRLQLKREKEEKAELPARKVTRRCARANRKADRIRMKLQVIIGKDEEANSILTTVAENQRAVRKQLVQMDPSLSVFFSKVDKEDEQAEENSFDVAQ